jgi:hypothetical protein
MFLDHSVDTNKSQTAMTNQGAISLQQGNLHLCMLLLDMLTATYITVPHFLKSDHENESKHTSLAPDPHL